MSPEVEGPEPVSKLSEYIGYLQKLQQELGDPQVAVFVFHDSHDMVDRYTGNYRPSLIRSMANRFLDDSQNAMIVRLQ